MRKETERLNRGRSSRIRGKRNFNHERHEPHEREKGKEAKKGLTTDFTDTTDGRRQRLRLGLVRNGSDEKIETPV
jgi:hypothetical protein